MAKDQPKEKAPDGPKTCFVVSPIGKDGSDHRRHADKLYKYVIAEVLEKPPFNYQCIRADKISQSGDVTTQIVDQLRKADLVVADLSFHNPNVFYELAIRHMTGLPFIHMISLADPIPFDVIANRAIQFDLSDLDSVDGAKRELSKQVAAVLAGEKTVSTFSEAIELDQLRNSDDPNREVLADLLVEVRQLRGEVRSSVPQGFVLPPATHPQGETSREISDIEIHSADKVIHVGNGVIKRQG